MTNTNTNKDEKETMRRMNDSADLHNKIMTKEEIRKSKCKTCGADTYIGLDGKEIHGKYLGKPKEIKEPIKEFDIMASKLGLDGEQMDELRVLLRKALQSQKEELLKWSINNFYRFMKEVWRPYRGEKTCGELFKEEYEKSTKPSPK